MVRRQGAVVTVITAAIALALAPSASASFFNCGLPGTSSCGVYVDDGGRVVFSDSLELITERPSDILPLYMRDGSDLSVLSRDPSGNPVRGVAAGATEDLGHIFFGTNANLTADDNDSPSYDTGDVYDLHDGAYSLITTGPTAAQFPDPLTYENTGGFAYGEDGQHVYFSTTERLTPDDQNNSVDAYERFNGVTRRISPSAPNASTEVPDRGYPFSRPNFLGSSPDGSKAYFSSTEQMAPGSEEPGVYGYYEWSDGNLRFVRINGTSNTYAVAGPTARSGFGGSLPNGSIVTPSTEALVPSDTDTDSDLYLVGGPSDPQLITHKPAGPHPECAVLGPPIFSEAGASFGCIPQVEDVSADGSKIFYSTGENMAPEDTDGAHDTYRYDLTNGETKLISGSHGNVPAYFAGTSRDGSHVAFSTNEQLLPDDKNDAPDLYEWNDGDLVLVSSGASTPAGSLSKTTFKAISPNGRFIAFTTLFALNLKDLNFDEDLYLYDADAGPPAKNVGANARKRSRWRLISAETVAPKVGIKARGAIADRHVTVRVGCPAREVSGPCKGKVTVRRVPHGKSLGTGQFQIKAGKADRVRIALNPKGLALGRRGELRTIAATARGRDRLGNARTVRSVVRLTRRP